jgi:hypothetical protein
LNHELKVDQVDIIYLPNQSPLSTKDYVTTSRAKIKLEMFLTKIIRNRRGRKGSAHKETKTLKDYLNETVVNELVNFFQLKKQV